MDEEARLHKQISVEAEPSKKEIMRFNPGVAYDELPLSI
jgi:hypothetical protein